MFKGFQNIHFISGQPKEKVVELIQEQLNYLGYTVISPKGFITIHAAKFEGIAHVCEIKGNLREKDGKYVLEIEWDSSPKWLIVIIGLFFFLIVAAIPIFLAYMAHEEIKSRVTNTFDTIRFEIGQ